MISQWYTANGINSSPAENYIGANTKCCVITILGGLNKFVKYFLCLSCAGSNKFVGINIMLRRLGYGNMLTLEKWHQLNQKFFFWRMVRIKYGEEFSRTML